MRKEKKVWIKVPQLGKRAKAVYRRLRSSGLSVDAANEMSELYHSLMYRKYRLMDETTVSVAYDHFHSHFDSYEDNKSCAEFRSAQKTLISVGVLFKNGKNKGWNLLAEFPEMKPS